MPYSREHKVRTRERVLAGALRLFSERGFAQVTIDEVMAHAGLTRGAFYAHFTSKEHLYAEAIDHGIRTSAIAALAGGPKGLKTLQNIVNSYLSRGHVDGKMAPCPLAFFSTDVGVREHRVRSTYTTAFLSLIGAIGSHASGAKTEERTLAIAVLMVGGVAVSTAVTDSTLKDNILSGCRRAIMDLVATTQTKASSQSAARLSPASRKRRVRTAYRRLR